jgi:hypothetical protein
LNYGNYKHNPATGKKKPYSSHLWITTAFKNYNKARFTQNPHSLTHFAFETELPNSTGIYT